MITVAAGGLPRRSGTPSVKPSVPASSASRRGGQIAVAWDTFHALPIRIMVSTTRF
jgi:hypothetical protein